MILGIERRTALVIGASSHIGQSIALELQVEGVRVVGVSRRDISFPRYGRHVQNDMMAPHGIHNLMVKLGENFSPDIIVHVLGGSQGVTDPLASMDDWERVWRLNVGVAHEVNRRFIPEMQRAKWGRIIHISSNAPRIGTGYCAYTSAKGALDAYVKMMSKEFSRDGIIISAVAPGIVDTPGRYFANLSASEQEEYFNKYIPIHRFGRAEEVAKLVSYLASEHAAYMAGSIVAIDGGAR